MTRPFLRRFLLMFLCVVQCPDSWAALSDTSAIKAAKARWGAVAMIGQTRCAVESSQCSATYWLKKVGFFAPRCVNDFSVVGKGLNTWDAALADADAHPAIVNGPYAGMLTIQVGAYDVAGVTSLELFIDGNPAQIIYPSPILPSYTGSWNVDTTTLTTNEFHVVCAEGTNSAGLTGKLDNGVLFKVNQATGQTGQTWLAGPDFPAFSAVTFNPH